LRHHWSISYNRIVKSWMAQIVLGIWLASGLVFLPSCAPTASQTPQHTPPPPLGSLNAPFSPPPAHFSNDAPIDSSQSTSLTDYLHSHQLPLVGARVLKNDSGPHQIILYGFVATSFGKADAADKARQFLNDNEAQVDNRIKIEPSLASSGGAPTPSTSGASPDNGSATSPDLQEYQNQQAEAQRQYQQYQYQNQGAGMMGLLPFLLMFGSAGGGSSGFGFGGGSITGSPYGYPPPSYPYPHNPYPGYPPPSYGYPYP